MGDAGGGDDDQGADGLGGTADRIGHEGRPTLMGDQGRADARRLVELVVEFSDVYSGDAEGMADGQLFEGIDGELGTGSFHNVSPLMARPAMRPVRMQPPRKVPSRAPTP